MFKKILIPLDESKLAEQVLPCALEIARHMKSEVTLLCAVPPIREGEVAEDGQLVYIDEIMETAQRKAREYLNAIAQPLHDEGIGVKTALEIGMPAECILDFSQTMDIDLIAMSTHGRGGVGRWVFGSVADRVLRNATCPVLLTRSGAATPHEAYINRILIPLDGSHLAERVLPYAGALAQAFNAEIILTRVVSLPTTIYGMPEALPLLVTEAHSYERQATDYLHEWQKYLEHKGLRSRVVIAQPPVAESLLAMAHTQNVNLIAMSTHGRSGVRRWVYGSVTDRVLQASNVPILLVRVTDNQPASAEEDAWAIRRN